jgi:glycerol-3-phosphate acyltransferase PlsX
MDDPSKSPCARRRILRCAWRSSRSRTAAAQAAISAGNTGALMALARYLLKTLDGIDRPAIAPQLPNAKGGATTVLDLGANVDCTPKTPAAVRRDGLGPGVGADRQRGAFGGPAEHRRGSHQGQRGDQEGRRTAAYGCAAGDLNFYGNVEGNDIFKGTTDIVVCDGFVGNVALKTSEGVASMIGEFIRVEFSRSMFTKLAAIVAYPVLKAFKSAWITAATTARRCWGCAAWFQEPWLG